MVPARMAPAQNVHCRGRPASSPLTRVGELGEHTHINRRVCVRSSLEREKGSEGYLLLGWISLLCEATYRLWHCAKRILSLFQFILPGASQCVSHTTIVSHTTDRPSSPLPRTQRSRVSSDVSVVALNEHWVCIPN